MTTRSFESLAEEYVRFGRMCDGTCPLYAALCPRVAEDSELLEWSAAAAPGQPEVNMLFAAVQFLLLQGTDHPLAAYYKSMGGTGEASAAWPHFRDFCTAHAASITQIIPSRRVQTNVVGRSAVLLPAICLAHNAFDRPLAMIEVGASAGLLLFMDRFQFSYSTGQAIGGESPVHNSCDVRGELRPAIPDAMPPIASRTGIDIAPVDVTDDDAMHWVQALIWPDEVDRVEAHCGAIAIARADPPRIVKGDALEDLAGLVAEVPDDCLPCIYHSHCIYQMTEAERGRFHELIATLGRQRDLAHVSNEWLGDDDFPRLHLALHERGEATRTHLAHAHHHGRWINWVADSNAANL